MLSSAGLEQVRLVACLDRKSKDDEEIARTNSFFLLPFHRQRKVGVLHYLSANQMEMENHKSLLLLLFQTLASHLLLTVREHHLQEDHGD